jgi:uncharacterized membrane protein (DUF4010 family)
MEGFDVSAVVNFLLTVVFSFIIGLELNKKKEKREAGEAFFGTERTLAFVGILGFVLLEGSTYFPAGYMSGWAALSVFLAIFYFSNIWHFKNFGLTKVLVAQLVYTLPLLLKTQPLWLALLVIVLVITLVEIKEQIKAFSQRIFSEEFITLAKFIMITGVILPLAPKAPLLEGFPLSFYKLWLAVVAISGISYLSYLVQKYVYPHAGTLLSGVLGGLYSSTATTFLLSKRSQDRISTPHEYAAGILSATMMMFIRVFVLIWLFKGELALFFSPYFGALIAGSALVVFFIYQRRSKAGAVLENMLTVRQNPLEFRMALVFSALYIFFSLITEYTLEQYGNAGLPVLSFIAGLADIDPFLISLLQEERGALSVERIALAAMQTITANNLLKMLYALVLSESYTRRLLLYGFGLINAGCIAVILFLY